MSNTTDAVIAFDFDGVIASYQGFISHADVQPPNPEVVKTMQLLREKGCKIMIHSTRGNDFLAHYCEQFSLPVDYINRRPDLVGENPGKPIAFVYIDDHALCYRGQNAEDLVDEVVNFKPYWRDA
ncbi:MAG: hypothetical protein AAB442_02645 [Patescibacteria group bacterium]